MKGALVLHALRYTVGDDAFKRLMRAFADQYRWSRAAIPDFQQVAERVSGQRLGWFFDEWLGRKGLPQFTYSFRGESGPNGQPGAVVRIHQQGEPYPTTLDHSLEVPKYVTLHPCPLDPAIQEF